MTPSGMRCWLILAALAAGVWACTRAADPPRGAAGHAFGDPPAAGLEALPVPLPGSVSEKLKFYVKKQGNEAFLGVGLVEPVLAFYENRFFSLSAALAGSADAQALRERLTRAFGPGYCRDAANMAVCLWRGGDVDMVLELSGAGTGRFMARHRRLADLVAAAAGPVGLTAPEHASEAVPSPGH